MHSALLFVVYLCCCIFTGHSEYVGKGKRLLHDQCQWSCPTDFDLFLFRWQSHITKTNGNNKQRFSGSANK